VPHFKKIALWMSFLAVLPCFAFASDPEHVALVDTGFDACMQSGGMNCEQNKNLLFRGGQPLPDDPPYVVNFDSFRQNIFSYISTFKNAYETEAKLPSSVDDLKNYRMVIINLLYDFNDHGSVVESTELKYEFKSSGQSSEAVIPEQHHMYGLESAFNENQYAFEWWPITFALLDDADANFVPMHMNWPGNQGTPPHSFEPKDYVLLDLPYFVSGIPYKDDSENPNAKDLRTLLTTIPADGHPLLIFYHCVAGKDRTGAVSASYFMKFGGYPYVSNEFAQKQLRSGPVNLKKALEFTTLPNRYPSKDSKNLSKAFCYYLNKSAGECSEHIG
jgi:hypothetical protein